MANSYPTSLFLLFSFSFFFILSSFSYYQNLSIFLKKSPRSPAIFFAFPIPLYQNIFSSESYSLCFLPKSPLFPCRNPLRTPIFLLPNPLSFFVPLQLFPQLLMQPYWATTRVFKIMIGLVIRERKEWAQYIQDDALKVAILVGLCMATMKSPETLFLIKNNSFVFLQETFFFFA